MIRFHYLLLLTSFGGAMLAAGCHRKAVASAAAATAVPRVLRFGSGGGFTGAVTTYSLTSEGRLDRRRGPAADTTQPATLLPAPSAAAVTQCFRALDGLPADSLTLRQPGNMYYFIEGKTAAGRPVALTWGAPNATVPKAARTLYHDLTALVPSGN